MTSFACRFYFNKIKFFTKNKQLKNSHKEISKRERGEHKKALCMQMTWWKLMLYAHVWWDRMRKVLLFVLLNLKHVKMIHFSTLHNHKKFVRAIASFLYRQVYKIKAELIGLNWTFLQSDFKNLAANLFNFSSSKGRLNSKSKFLWKLKELYNQNLYVSIKCSHNF